MSPVSPVAYFEFELSTGLTPDESLRRCTARWSRPSTAGLEAFKDEEDYRGPLVFRLVADPAIALPRRLEVLAPLFPRAWGGKAGGRQLPGREGDAQTDHPGHPGAPGVMDEVTREGGGEQQQHARPIRPLGTAHEIDLGGPCG